MKRLCQRTILCVDDDVGLLLALKKRLEHAGLRVLTAGNAARALELAGAGGVDAITLDVGLPDEIDGIEAARRMRSDPQTAHIPILFVTGRADAAFRTRCESVGARYFLAKPYDAEVLLHLLESVFAADELAELRRLSQAKRRQPV
jgi:CheY-like chemotaxis protein